MTDINNTALRRLDLTMLLVFAETMQLRKLTLVAKRLGLTQSAISHTLSRLRDAYDDPLFLRKPHGLEPTARALQLEPTIATLIALAQSSITAPQAFDPIAESRQVRLASLDLHASLLGPALCRLFEKQAPGLTVVFKAAARRAALDMLDSNEADLVIGFMPGLPQAFLAETLYEEGYAVIAGRKNKGFDGSLESYLAARHLLVSLSGDLHGIVDDALAEKGLKRNIVGSYPLFFPVLAAVSATDHIATVPRRLAAANARRFGLVLHEPPITIRSYPVRAVWHRRNAKDGALQWVVRGLHDIVSGPIG
jgi:DNA-binding transcriptional LysR family regulator